MSEFIIQTKNLNFQFDKSRKILDNLCLNIPKGSIYGFLGPNGAGKSTTMRLITGLINQQGENSIYLFEKPLTEQLPQVFEKVGCIIEHPTLYLHLSGYDNLRYVATIRNVAEVKIAEVLEVVELTKFKKVKAGQYSLGMKQRLAIAMALLNDPELLILDEPVNGLDPQGIIDIRNLLKKINKEKGTTIFISSHLLAEIEKTCTHVAILNQGKVEFEGLISELKTNNVNTFVRIKTDDLALHESTLQQFETKKVAQNEFDIKIEAEAEIPIIIQKLVQLQIPIFEVKSTGGLEDWFMNVTKK